MDTLRLELVSADENGFAAKMYVNGVDVTVTGSHIGMDPAQFWLTENLLLPTKPARRVAIACCSCGVLSCSGLYATIAEADGVVHWDVPGLPRMSFSSAAYRVEVLRLQHDVAWESPGRTATRILFSMAPPSSWKANRMPLHLHWPGTGTAHNDPASFAIVLRYKGNEIYLRLPWENSSPVEMAERAYALLASSPRLWVAHWARFFHTGAKIEPPAIAGPHWTQRK